MPGNAPDLKQLYDQTISTLSSEGVITRALDWVDQVVPRFVSACRASLRDPDTGPIESWLDWVNSDRVQVIEETGKGVIYAWRRDWLRILLTITQAVSGRFGTAEREPITRGGVRHGKLQWAQGLEEPISLTSHTARILNTRLEAVLDCERSLYCPDKVSDLHQMCLALGAPVLHDGVICRDLYRSRWSD